MEETRHQAEYQNRGTENDMIVFSPTTSDRPVLAWDVVAPGQSGFIAPDGTVDKHYEDQLKMYENFGRKSLWLTKQDVEAHKESQEVLHVQGSLTENALPCLEEYEGDKVSGIVMLEGWLLFAVRKR